MIGVLAIVFSVRHLPKVLAVREPVDLGRMRGRLTDVKVVGHVRRVTNFPGTTGKCKSDSGGARKSK
jgi:hypothetical protein